MYIMYYKASCVETQHAHCSATLQILFYTLQNRRRISRTVYNEFFIVGLGGMGRLIRRMV